MTIRHLLLVSLIVGMVTGCSSGVTDVGNPKTPADQPSSMETSLPAVGDLVGVYQLQKDDSLSPCAIHSDETPQITAGDGPTKVVIQHFLAVSVASDSIVTDYDANSGLLGTLDTQDDNVCTGSAKFVNTDVQVTLACQTSGTNATECESVFLKVNP